MHVKTDTRVRVRLDREEQFPMDVVLDPDDLDHVEWVKFWVSGVLVHVDPGNPEEDYVRNGAATVYHRDHHGRRSARLVAFADLPTAVQAEVARVVAIVINSFSFAAMAAA